MRESFLLYPCAKTQLGCPENEPRMHLNFHQIKSPKCGPVISDFLLFRMRLHLALVSIVSTRLMA